MQNSVASAQEIANSLIINLGDMLIKDSRIPDELTFAQMRVNEDFNNLLKGFIKMMLFTPKQNDTYYPMSNVKDVVISDELLSGIYTILDAKTKKNIVEFRLDTINKSIELNHKQCADFLKGTIAREIASDTNFPFKTREKFYHFRTKSPNITLMIDDTIKLFMFITSGGDIMSPFNIADIRKRFTLDGSLRENICFEIDELQKEAFIL